MAPYSPALGPRPELTPKARASGSATIPAVRPPKRSPRKCEKSKENKFFMKKKVGFKGLIRKGESAFGFYFEGANIGAIGQVGMLVNSIPQIGVTAMFYVW